jgi:hypothetical protein
MILDANGNFSGTDLPAQEVTVTVDTEALNPNRKKQVYGGGAGQPSPIPGGGTTTNTANYVKIPARYAKKQTSDLKITLTNGEQVRDIELKD